MRYRAISTILAAALIAIVVAASLVGYFLLRPTQTTSTTSCSSCFIQQPVVDVIIPELASKSDQNGGVNEMLNVSSGQTATLHVQIFTEQAVNVTLSFKSFIANANSSQTMTGSFSPPTLAASLNGNATSVLHIFISPDVPNGVYSAAVSAVGIQNSSWVWGDYFNINVTG